MNKEMSFSIYSQYSTERFFTLDCPSLFPLVVYLVLFLLFFLAFFLSWPLSHLLDRFLVGQFLVDEFQALICEQNVRIDNIVINFIHLKKTDLKCLLYNFVNIFISQEI